MKSEVLREVSHIQDLQPGNWFVFLVKSKVDNVFPNLTK